jgi:hypothetical protein
VTNAGFQRLTMGANEFRYWSMATTLTLASGPHTTPVRAEPPIQTPGFTMNVSGNNTSVLQGQLSVVIIKK